jgi:CheY-like chemotaxis protein
MHWLGDAASRAGLKGAGTLLIPNGTSTGDAWEMGARALGTSPGELATRIAPAVHLGAAALDGAQPEAIRLLPEKLARRYNIFPLRDNDRQLVVATADPHNIECEQAVAFASGRRVVFELAPPHALSQAIDRAYASDRTTEPVLAHLDADLTPTNLERVVLIVDDDPVQRLLVSSTLERSGFRVAQACDGAEALRRIRAGEECGLLLTDFHMPEMDGGTLIKKLRADPRSAALPIIVLTGSTEDDRESDLIDIGADDYIRKPVDPTRLLARVRAALRRVA